MIETHPVLFVIIASILVAEVNTVISYKFSNRLFLSELRHRMARYNNQIRKIKKIKDEEKRSVDGKKLMRIMMSDSIKPIIVMGKPIPLQMMVIMSLFAFLNALYAKDNIMGIMIFGWSPTWFTPYFVSYIISSNLIRWLHDRFWSGGWNGA